MEPLLRIQLTDRQRARLLKPVVGEGGFQSLLRQLQGCVQGDALVITEPRLLVRLNRYRDDYGHGGWQARLGLTETDDVAPRLF